MLCIGGSIELRTLRTHSYHYQNNTVLRCQTTKNLLEYVEGLVCLLDRAIIQVRFPCALQQTAGFDAPGSLYSFRGSRLPSANTTCLFGDCKLKHPYTIGTGFLFLRLAR
jgi:hypothetical protein